MNLSREIQNEIERIIFECERYERLSGGFSAAHILSQGFRFLRDNYNITDEDIYSVARMYNHRKFIIEYFGNR